MTGLLYKRDSQGRIRTWEMELDLERGQYRSIAGLRDGEKVVSGWTQAVPASQPTAREQAAFEVEAEYNKKRRLGYSTTIEDVDAHTFFQPMLAQKWVGEVGWVQPKLDGIRCIAKADGLWTRQGKPINSVPHVWEALQPLFEKHEDLILDGELYNHDLRDNFNQIASLVRKTKNIDPKEALAVQYHVYDLVDETGFSGRLRQLVELNFVGEHLKLVENRWCPTPELGDESHGDFIEHGFEGSIVRLDGPYENKRSSKLLKRKEFLDQEFRIRRVEEGIGNWAGYAKRVVLELPDGRTFGAGVRGSQDHLRNVLANADTYEGTLATVRYFQLTPDGIPRFPVVTDLGRED